MNNWQGQVVPPYEADALPLINPRTDKLSGNFRAMVTGGQVTLWNGEQGTSRATSGTIYPSREEAVRVAQLWIDERTDGLLDPVMFAFTESPKSEEDGRG